MRRPSHRTFALANEYHRRMIPPEILRSGTARTRCVRCRRQLWFHDLAFDGKYCTITCAEPERGALIVRARLLYDAWRRYAYCSRCRSGRGATKRNYHSPQAAGRAAASVSRSEGIPAWIYRCPWNPETGWWHVTTRAAPKRHRAPRR